MECAADVHYVPMDEAAPSAPRELGWWEWLELKLDEAEVGSARILRENFPTFLQMAGDGEEEAAGVVVGREAVEEEMGRSTAAV